MRAPEPAAAPAGVSPFGSFPIDLHLRLSEERMKEVLVTGQNNRQIFSVSPQYC